MTANRVRTNRYPAPCMRCGQTIPAGEGLLVPSPAASDANPAWQVTHPPARWVGSPVSGQWLGSCPPVQAHVPTGTEP